MNTSAERTEALVIDVTCSNDALSVTLTDGRVVSVPLVWFPRLADASPKQRSDWELIGGGIGVHWDSLDEDISVASLLHPENFVGLPERKSPSYTPPDRPKTPSRRRRTNQG